MAEHYRTVCSVCEKIITTCRCPSPTKIIHKEICRECVKKGIEKITKRENNA